MVIPQKVLYQGKRFFRFLKMFFTQRKKKIWNCSMKGPLGIQKGFFYGIAVKTYFWNPLFFKSVGSVYNEQQAKC